MIKDPLQPDQTPFELLGLSQDADDKAIKAAFNQRMRGAGKQLPKLKQARETLLRNPVERSVVGLFFYDPEMATRLQPAPDDPDALGPERRGETAKAWSGQFTKAFPDPAIAHALGVLWYWQGAQLQRELEEALEAGAGPATKGREVLDCWRRACAYWAVVLATPGFWQARGAIPEELRAQVREHLVESRLRHRLQDMVQRCRELEAGELADAYGELLRALSTELEIAEQLSQTGIKAKGRPVCCGPILLGMYKLQGRFRGQVAQALEKKPGDARLTAIQAALSPYTHLAVLIKEGRYEAALEAVEQMPEAEWEQPDVVAVVREARLGLGDQQAEMDRFETALEHWRAAREAADSEPEGLRKRVLALCERATVKLTQDLDRAIEVLQAGCALVEDEGLRRKLGALLNQRGGAAFMKGLKPWQEGDQSEENLALMRRGLEDLEQAESLGDPGAGQQAEMAREAMLWMGEHPGLPEHVRRPLRRAENAAAKQQWGTACSCLLAVLDEVGQERKRALEKRLAVMLNNYGLEKFNAAAERIPRARDLSDVQSIYQDGYEAWLDLKHASDLDAGNVTIVQVFNGVGGQLQQIVQQFAQNPYALVALQTAKENAARARRQRVQEWKRSGRSLLEDKPAAPTGSVTVPRNVEKSQKSGSAVGGWVAAFAVFALVGFGLMHLGRLNTEREPASVPGAATRHVAAGSNSNRSGSSSSLRQDSVPRDVLQAEIGRLQARTRADLSAGEFGSARKHLLQLKKLQPDASSVKDLAQELVVLQLARTRGLVWSNRFDKAKSLFKSARSNVDEFGLDTTQLDELESDLFAKSTTTWSELAEKKRREEQQLAQRLEKECDRLNTRARAQLNAGNHQGALKSMIQARKLIPENPVTQALLEELLRIKLAKARLLGSSETPTQAKAFVRDAFQFALRFSLDTTPIVEVETELAKKQMAASSPEPEPEPEVMSSPPPRRDDPERYIDYVGKPVVIHLVGGDSKRGILSNVTDTHAYLKTKMNFLGRLSYVKREFSIQKVVSIALADQP